MSRIALDYATLEAAHSQILSQSGEMEGTLTDLRTKLDNMDWEGADKASYEEAKADWDSAYAKIIEILQGVGNAVESARARYEETERANANRFG